MAELTRRDLLARAGLAAGALALGATDEAEAAPDLRGWAGVRAQFALDRGRIHLASFLLAAHPRPVRATPRRSVFTRRSAGCACNRAYARSRHGSRPASRMCAGVRIRTPAGAGLSAGLVCFEVGGTDPEVVRRLAACGIVGSVTPYAQRYVRIGPGIVDTPAELDAAVRAIAAL